jgi:hypothetical protein
MTEILLDSLMPIFVVMALGYVAVAGPATSIIITSPS